MAQSFARGNSHFLRHIGSVAVLALLLSSCGAATPTLPPTPASAAQAVVVQVPARVSVQDVAKLRTSGAFILDVREPSEWNEFHLQDSTLIPLGQLPNRVAEVPKDRPIVVVCRSGNRSQAGWDVLVKAGWINFASMDGGLMSRRANGLPVVSGP